MNLADGPKGLNTSPEAIAARLIADVADLAMRPIDEAAESERLTALPGGVFMAQFHPLQHLIDNLVPRGFVISFTAPTGHGKTAIATLMELCIVTKRSFAGHEVDGGGNVLVLCGENPDDYCMRLIATCQQQGIEPFEANGVNVIPSVFNLEHKFDEIDAEAKRLGGVSAVFVDTSAAFYFGSDENGNVEMKLHASSLRALTTIPGKPSVIVLCHPVKNAGKDNLIPRGGGSFLAEVDGNLTAWKDDSGVVTMHWAGKFRGPGFDPIRFELKSWPLAGYVDGRGRPVMSVVALHVPDERVEQIEARALDDENRLLIAMCTKRDASISQLALACGWVSGTGGPSKSRVARTLEKLRAQALVEKDRTGAWQLTPKGRKEADKLP